MANAIKGEVALQHDGKTYTMVLDINALAEFEDATGMDPGEVLDNPKTMSLSLARKLFWAGLQKHHPGLTLREAGDILQENFGKLGKAMATVTPEPRAGNVEGAAKAKRPRRR